MSNKPFKMKASGYNNRPMQKNFPNDINAPNPGDSPLEKFSWGGALKGALGGAVKGFLAGGPVGAIVGAVGGGAVSGIQGGKEQEEQEALVEAEKLQEGEKNKMLAKLAVEKKQKERESVGYSGFDSTENA